MRQTLNATRIQMRMIFAHGLLPVGFEAAATLILVLNNQRQIEVFFTDYIPAMPAHCHEGRS